MIHIIVFLFWIASIFIFFTHIFKKYLISNFLEKLNVPFNIFFYGLNVLSFILIILDIVAGPIFSIIDLFVIIIGILNIISPYYLEKIDDYYYELESVYAIKDIDEETLKSIVSFESVKELKKYLYDMYFKIQYAKADGDVEVLSNCCTNELFNMYFAQVKIDKIKNEKLVLKSFKKKYAALFSLTENNGVVEAHLLVRISFKEYFINSQKKVVDGSRFKRKVKNVDLTFVYDKNRKSFRNCPSCGAYVDTNVSEFCDYCSSVIVLTPRTFALSSDALKVPRKKPQFYVVSKRK